MRDESYVDVQEQVVENPPSADIDTSLNIGGVIIAPTGPRFAQVTGQKEFLKLFTKNGTIPRDADISLINAYYLLQSTAMVLARAENTQLRGGILVMKGGSVINPVLFDDNNSIVNYKKDGITVTFPNWTGWCMIFGDLLLYCGEMPNIIDTSAYTLTKVSTAQEFIAALSTLGDVYFDTVSVAGDNIHPTSISFNMKFVTNETSFYYNTTASTDVSKLPTTASGTGKDASKGDGYTQIVPEAINSQIVEDNILFGIISDYVTTSNLFKIKLQKVSDDVMRLRIISSHDSSEVGTYYDFSLKKDTKDENGQNIYIDYLNDLDLSLTFYNPNEIDNTNTPTVTNDIEFGGSSVFNEKTSKTLPHITSALTALEDQEVYSIDGLCLLGLQTTPTIGQQIARLFAIEGPKHKWACPVGVPKTYKNRRSIFGWAESLGLPEPDPVPGVIMMGPFDKNTSLVGWNVYIDPGCKYWERIKANQSLGREFAPVFHEDYGSMNMTSPCVELGKTDRNILLNRRKAINWIVRNEQTKVFYLNQNWSWQESRNNVLEEENIVRQMWKISRDVDPILAKFFAHFNNRSTRQQAYDLVDYYMEWNIMNKEFAPLEYRITCDRTNNTDENIRNHWINMLIEVRYQGSIKWAKVINRAYPLGIDFTNVM